MRAAMMAMTIMSFHQGEAGVALQELLVPFSKV